MKRSMILLLAVSIIGIGVIGAVVFVKTKPAAERKKPPRMTPVVECQALVVATQEVRLDVMGTVMAAQSIELKPQVSGEIIRTDANWIEGGRLAKGTPVITLEPRDYEIALQQAEADLAQAESELTLELGRQDVAKREWELLGMKGSERDRDLAQRVPQLRSTKARVEASKARREQAELALSRTRIPAPFNALVTSRRMNRGDIASPQMSVGTLVSTDAFHIRASVPVDQLRWIELPNGSQPGSGARVLLPDDTAWDGRVIRLLADLEAKGRMARVLVEVPDPLKGESPILLGSYVDVQIEGRQIENAHRIQRQHYREGGRIWLMTPEKTLRIVAAQPIWSDRASVIVRFEALPGEQLIVSDLVAAIDGMDLRLAGETRDDEEGDKRERRDRSE